MQNYKSQVQDEDWNTEKRRLVSIIPDNHFPIWLKLPTTLFHVISHNIDHRYSDHTATKEYLLQEKAGDCQDQSVLLANGLANMTDVSFRFVRTKNDSGDAHVFVQIGYPKAHGSKRLWNALEDFYEVIIEQETGAYS